MKLVTGRVGDWVNSITNSPIHQLTNSPTHQLTNSPTSLFHRDFEQRGGPAAAEALTAVAGVIVRGEMQHVIARLAEGGRGGGLAAEEPLALRHLRDLRPRLVELHLARTAIFRPPQADRRTIGRRTGAGAARVLHVVGDEERQLERLAHGGR